MSTDSATGTDSSSAQPEEIAAPNMPGGESAAAVACCEQSDAKTMKPCTLCQKTLICKNCRMSLNGKSICAECTAGIVEELEAEKATTAHLPMALAAGIAAAVLSGAIWAAIAVITGYSIGYVAIGVGYLAGHAVVIGGRKRKVPVLQYTAVGCAFLGLVFGKYFIFAHFNAVKPLKEQFQVDISYFDPQVIQLFMDNFTKTLSPIDILFLVIALAVAWGVPKPTEIKLR